MKNNKMVIFAVALLLLSAVTFVFAFRKLSNRSQNKGMVLNVKNMGGKQGSGQFKGINKANERRFDTSTIDYTTAAQKLNITEGALKTAMAVLPGQRLNLENIATTLGVNIVDLRTALGMPEMGPPKVGNATPNNSIPSGTQD